MTNKMIIERLTRVIEDWKLTPSEYSEKYHVPLDSVADAMKYKGIAVLEVIADELIDEEKAREARESN